MILVLGIAASVVAVCLAYGWFEGGWLRTRVLEVSIPELPEALDGIRIGHLSDFHLGAPFSRGTRATRRAVEWVGARRPDLVCVTGDLVSHPRGAPLLSELLGLLDRPFVVLGNHDVAVTRDPFSRAAELRDLSRARLLRDEGETVVVGGVPISVVGIDPATFPPREGRPHVLADDGAAFRLLLCHFPDIVDTLPLRTFDLVLSGHLHAGQICLPWPGRRIALAHPRARFVTGLYRTERGVMHVSPGTGTTFVPLRLLARPEVTELVLRRQN